MKSKLLIFFLLAAPLIYGQNAPISIRCGTSEVNALHHDLNPGAKAEYDAFNFRTGLNNYLFLNKLQTDGTVVIPVVFHVYGTSFNGKTVSESLIQDALEAVNRDFHGLNDDFGTVDPMFQPIRGTMDIRFELARIDPEGNATTGVVFHPNNNGFGDHETKNEEIQADAWDNYSYMNVYVQNDLYGDGVTNNSGVAWYPSTWMSERNLARVVYNGAYLGTNTDKEFASVLTHEFGHWLNLIHPFEGGCAGTDEVDDTPQEDGNHSLGCSLGTNCGGVYINHENYMGYNGSWGCYKMFTAGQVARMEDALEHPAIHPLWQEDNLIRTGIIEGPELFPELRWVSLYDSYQRDQSEFARVEAGKALEILDQNQARELTIEKPDGTVLEINLEAGIPLRIEPLEPGTWIISIPELGKRITKQVE
jgi:hypothetical protein